MTTKTKSQIIRPLVGENLEQESLQFIVEDSLLDSLNEFCFSKVLSDAFEKNTKATRNLLLCSAWNLWVEELWARSTNPGSARILGLQGDAENVAALLVVPDTFDISLKNGAEEPEEWLGKKLTMIKRPKAFIEKEIKFIPTLSLDLSKLDKDTLTMFIGYLTNGGEITLDEDNRGKFNRALVPNLKYEVKAGFLNRICSYVNSVENLTSLLEIITPRVQLRSAKVGLSSPEEIRRASLVNKAESILKDCK